MANTQSLPNSISLYIDPIGDPIQWLHPFLFCTACCVSQVCYRLHYNTDLALGASREFTLSRVSEEFNLHSTPQLTLRVSAGYGNLKR